MQCYKSFHNDRTCDICKKIDIDVYNRCKVAKKIWCISEYTLRCEHCNRKSEYSSGSDPQYGYDSDYESYEYICGKTGKECKFSNLKDECLDFFVKELL